MFYVSDLSETYNSTRDRAQKDQSSWAATRLGRLLSGWAGKGLYVFECNVRWSSLPQRSNPNPGRYQTHINRNILYIKQSFSILKRGDDGSSFSEEQLVMCTLDLHFAGTDTTSNTLLTGFLYLTTHPHIQGAVCLHVQRCSILLFCHLFWSSITKSYCLELSAVK